MLRIQFYSQSLVLELDGSRNACDYFLKQYKIGNLIARSTKKGLCWQAKEVKMFRFEHRILSQVLLLRV